ncbi:MAG: ankyrin repeat domain-containing protein [Legionellaceae bacterium]|nr:ankyrin repeat domain-containing protein [Legionellaceae bacterium]
MTAHDVMPKDLFQALELTLTDGPKALLAKAEVFKTLWEAATPEVRRAQNAAGQTVLHLMIEYGFEALLADTLKALPSLALRHQKDKGEYPIHTAIANQQIKAAELLLNLPGVARLKNQQGQTALHYAARFGSQDMMLLCCRKHVGDMNERDRSGKTPLALAKEENTPDVEAVLVAHGADENLIES